MTAGELLAKCKLSVQVDTVPAADQGEYIQSNALRIGWCDGFVSGWVEAINGSIIDSDVLYVALLARNTTVGQLVRIFVLYMRSHPELENGSAGYALGRAAIDANVMILVPHKPSTEKTSARP